MELLSVWVQVMDTLTVCGNAHTLGAELECVKAAPVRSLNELKEGEPDECIAGEQEHAGQRWAAKEAGIRRTGMARAIEGTPGGSQQQIHLKRLMSAEWLDVQGGTTGEDEQD
eukprot:6236325-Amphidinium_carterae.1